MACLAGFLLLGSPSLLPAQMTYQGMSATSPFEIVEGPLYSVNTFWKNDTWSSLYFYGTTAALTQDPAGTEADDIDRIQLYTGINEAERYLYDRILEWDYGLGNPSGQFVIAPGATVLHKITFSAADYDVGPDDSGSGPPRVAAIATLIDTFMVMQGGAASPAYSAPLTIHLMEAPEPSTWLLFATGLGGLLVYGWRRTPLRMR